MTLHPRAVTVIVPVYRAEKYIKRCLDSLLNQTYADVEIMVVYDESPDRTLDVLQEFDGRIKLLIQSKTSPAIARNNGVYRAEGSYIAFCDADDAFHPEKLEAQLSLMSAPPFPPITYTDMVIEDSMFQMTSLLRAREWNRDEWLSDRDIAFSSLVVSRSILEEMHTIHRYYFDESLSAFDDFDFIARASLVSPLTRVPGFLTRIARHSSNLSNDTWRMTRIRSQILLKNRLVGHFMRSLLGPIPKSFIQHMRNGR